ncbi:MULTISPECIES: hypothetical protein [unclassified Crossiella]|uniref:hypothetical protein n=1 Tax=unclassified Crossiella TaxID=2620835 RepID=UPI001FFF94AC|nr:MULTISPECIES: hypothetical protein [unclassified Crossiella]MCK2236443.1 hypothetical protein [Crossiella sp. S99.2]MCK2250110.1 hypothetical protein [Crossiella sp. S99.1]
MRTNRRPDLAEELREIRRRLRLLEGLRPPAPPAAFTPVRPLDWPGTGSADWEPLLVAAVPAGEVEILLSGLVSAGAAAVRVLVDGEPAGAELAWAEGVAGDTMLVRLDRAAEITVAARVREDGAEVRVQAVLGTAVRAVLAVPSGPA